jgi:hypothetical protein
MNENEKVVSNIFLKRFGIILNEIPENPPQKTPDFAFEISGFKILAEQKTIEDALMINLDKLKLEKNSDGIFEYEKLGEDNTWSRVARAIEKASAQLELFMTDLKAVILLNNDCASIDDLDDIIKGHRTIGEIPLPQGAIIARQNWKCTPNLIFWIDKTENKIDIRSIGEIPEAITTFFQEKLNA